MKLFNESWIVKKYLKSLEYIYILHKKNGGFLPTGASLSISKWRLCEIGIYLFIYLLVYFNRDHAYSWTLLYKNTPCKYARISNNNYFSSAVPRQVT